MTEEVDKHKTLTDMVKVLELMVNERTYQYRLEIDTLQRKLENEEKTNFILHQDRNEVFKLWDMHRYRLEIAIKALEYFANQSVYNNRQDAPILIDGLTMATEALAKINDE